jgi:hypothetical protein
VCMYQRELLAPRGPSSCLLAGVVVGERKLSVNLELTEDFFQTWRAIIIFECLESMHMCH